MKKSLKLMGLLLVLVLAMSFVGCEANNNPVVNVSGHKAVNYGTYAQNLVTNEGLIAELDGAYWQGNKTEYKGTEYVKVSATPYRNGATFSNGTKIVEGEVYYFSVDPISWYSLGNGYYVTEKLLDISVFDTDTATDANGFHPNNWAESDLRKWMNGEFLSTAFSSFDVATIEAVRKESAYPESYYETHSVNVAATTDKVYALSYAETVSADYGFDADGTAYDFLRMAKVSDYARAKGAYFYISTATEDDADYERETYFDGNGEYWLRTIGWERVNAGCVRYNGTVGKHYRYVNSYYEKNTEDGKTVGGVCVRPAIKLAVEF